MCTELAPAVTQALYLVSARSWGEGVAAHSRVGPGGNPDVSKVRARFPPLLGLLGPNPAPRPPRWAVPAWTGWAGDYLRSATRRLQLPTGSSAAVAAMTLHRSTPVLLGMLVLALCVLSPPASTATASREAAQTPASQGRVSQARVSAQGNWGLPE